MTRRLLSFKDACAYLGDMPEKRLRRLVFARKIPHYRDGRLFFYSDELDDWLKRRRTAAVDEPRSKHVALAVVKREVEGIDDLMPRQRRLGG